MGSDADTAMDFYSVLLGWCGESMGDSGLVDIRHALRLGGRVVVPAADMTWGRAAQLADKHGAMFWGYRLRLLASWFADSPCFCNELRGNGKLLPTPPGLRVELLSEY